MKYWLVFHQIQSNSANTGFTPSVFVVLIIPHLSSQQTVRLEKMNSGQLHSSEDDSVLVSN